MTKIKNTLLTVRSIAVFIYAIFLFLLIPIFFFNHGGDWIKKVAQKIPLREMNMNAHE